MSIKKLGIGTKWATYKELKERCVVAQGWFDSKDLSFLTVKTESITKFLHLFTNGAQSGTNAFQNLFRELKQGDIVLAFEGNSLKGICELPLDFLYFYDSKFSYANSLFPVRWVDWDEFCNDKSDKRLSGQDGQGVVGITNCGLTEINNFISRNWNHFKTNNNIDIQPPEHEEQLKMLKDELPIKIELSRRYYYELLAKYKRIENMKNTIDLLKSNKNIILTGAPGTGKTFLAKEIAKQMTGIHDDNNSQIGFVQFHPSFDYTDFIEGLRPEKDDSHNSIGFKLCDGIFRKFCNQAKNNLENKYVFIIDEINRGEISKVFGELFFSIDPGYRGVKGQVKTQYANLRNEIDQHFYVPENVYIIGTMNDIDRSVESFDFAMRRRFAWSEVTAKDSQLMLDEEDVWKNKNKKINIDNEEIKTIKNRMNNLNNAIVDKYDYSNSDFKDHSIKLGLSDSFQIGASYFLKLGLYVNSENKITDDSYNSLWNNHLKGVLFEYLRGTQDVKNKLDGLRSAFDNKTI